MQFFKSILAVSALASIASATNSLTFVSQDKLDRSIYFTPAAGQAPVDPVVLKGHATASTEVPQGWIGNFWGVIDGDKNTGSGTLGEFTFNAFAGLTFYDVSTIVVPNDKNNVKMIFPTKSQTPVAGCQSYETVCNNCYNKSDDNLATKSSPETEFTIMVGTAAPGRRHAKDISARAPEVSATQQ